MNKNLYIKFNVQMGIYIDSCCFCPENIVLFILFFSNLDYTINVLFSTRFGLNFTQILQTAKFSRFRQFLSIFILKSQYRMPGEIEHIIT